MKVKTNKSQIKKLLHDQKTEEVIIQDHLEKKLKQGQSLRIKFGVDPTADVLHLGHTVCLLKLKQFQKLGHQIIFLIGDFTSRIGDPSGKVKSRPVLTPKEIKDNMKSYKQQAAKILDIDKVEVRYNSEWWEDMSLSEFMKLLGKTTYGQVVKRADFQKRIDNDEGFTIQEFVYPIIQGYDSVALEADVEVGGTDQKFNLLMGRKIQKSYNQDPQDIITCPLLEGTDGTKKMSQSKDNYIAITADPKDMYGKIMSVPDKLMSRYYHLLTGLSKTEIKQRLSKHPREAKASLAEELVSFYHSSKEAKKAAQEFDRKFKKGQTPQDIPTRHVDQEEMNILDLLMEVGLTSSKGEGRRLMKQKGIRIDKEVQTDPHKAVKIQKGMILQRGKRKFVKIS